jgi:hypothetical protein
MEQSGEPQTGYVPAERWEKLIVRAVRKIVRAVRAVRKPSPY